MSDIVAAGGGLESALKNDWLEIWYQPKVDLVAMAVCGAEALIRMRHPVWGLLQPSAFLPPAGHPAYHALTMFVVQQAIADWSVLLASSNGDAWTSNRLAINVPASILQEPDFVRNVQDSLPEMDSFPGLIFEITESEAMSNPDQAREAAEDLRLLDIHVSIDDFGAGHSTLARLSELPFAELKLDRRYVDGCSRDREKRAMCRAAVGLAQRFDLAAVAEGVESSDDLATLIGMGFKAAQGFFFAKPMTHDGLAGKFRALDVRMQSGQLYGNLR